MVALPLDSGSEPSLPPQPERRRRDDSQKLRLALQLAFILLNAWICIEFYIWVRAIESGSPLPMARPTGVDGWLPIAGLLNLKAWIATGVAPAVHPAAAVLIASFLTMSLLLKKSFCSWLCPVGTLSEYLWKLGKKLFGVEITPPKWLDIPLRGLKYLLLAFFLWIAVTMPVEGIVAFMEAPYGVIADVKMLNFFRFISATSLSFIALMVVFSLYIKNFWCRYLCPYGALLGIISLLSPVAIRRDTASCIDCTKCAKACPSRLPVDRLLRVRSAECSLCMSCVAVCPVRGALEVKVTPEKRVAPWAVAVAVAAIFLGFVTAARLSGNWHTEVSEEIYRYLVTSAENVGH